jgi:hypothetical protein
LSPQEIVNLGGSLGAALAAMAVWASVMRAQQPGLRRWRILATAPVILLPIVVGMMIWATLTGLDQTKPVLDRIFQDAGNMALATFALGLVLYIFRREERALYGVAEIAFGLATAAYVGWQATGGTMARLIAFAGAIYIVVRGLDNLDTARKAADGTPFTRWISGRKSRNSPEPAAEARGIDEAKQPPKPPSPDRS